MTGSGMKTGGTLARSEAGLQREEHDLTIPGGLRSFAAVLFSRSFALLVCAFLAAQAHADPLADLAKSSSVGQVDLAELAGGKVTCVRGPTLSAARDLSVQSVYVIHAPVAKTLEMHKQWDAAKHPELKVYLHHDLPATPTPADFAVEWPSNAAVRELIAATQKLPESKGLQLSNDEAKAFKGSGFPAVHDFWSQLLYRRASSYAKDGVSKQPPYDFAGGGSRPAGEVARLLKEQPKIFSAFRPIIGGEGVSRPSRYWEMFDAQDQANFLLGDAFSLSVGDSAQLLDLQYYASGGFYAYVTLYQMWPVTIDAKPATLVWRVDCISSQELSELQGTEKIGSASGLRSEVVRTIELFKKDVER